MKRLQTFLLILRLDIVRSAVTAEVFSWLLYVGGCVLLPFSQAHACSWLMRSHRNARQLERQLKIENLLQKYNLLRDEIVKQLVSRVDVEKIKIFPSWVFKLKEPGEGEKGVLLVRFNDTLTVFPHLYDVERILNDYYLVFEPSHSGYCDPGILQYLAYRNDRIVIQASEPKDFTFLKRLNGNLVPVGFGASDWIDDRVFRPLGLKKEFDCVMVAVYNDIKRHQVLLRAVSAINDPSYRVALLGGNWNLTQDDIEAIAEYYGVRRNITFFREFEQPEVNELLNRAKVNVLLSLREGANKSIFEGFFADVPGIVPRLNLGVNKSYINEQTGRLVDDRELADVLMWFRTEYRKFHPRAWAEKNISCPATAKKLETTLKEISSELGQPWTRPPAIKVNSGVNPAYYDKTVHLSPIDPDQYRRNNST